MPSARQQWGTSAEDFAAKYLQNQGIDIMQRHYTTRYGEIDLIGREGDEWVFVEVKARRTREYGIPEEAVTPEKIRRIARAINIFLSQCPERHPRYRLDVVALEYYEPGPPVLRHLRAVG